jgi:hypothetical protein
MAFIVFVAGVTGVTVLYQFIVYPLLLSPVANVPAVHPLAKLSSLYILWIRFWDNENAIFFAAHQKYGQVIRLGPHELSVNCVDDGIKTIYGNNFDRHSFYCVYQDCGRENLSSSFDASSHALRRRRIAHVYSKSYLQTSPAVTGLVNRIIRLRLLGLIAGHARCQQPFDTMTLLSALALDRVTGYTFGTDNGTNFLSESNEHS